MEELSKSYIDPQKTAEETAVYNGLFENAQENAEVIFKAFFSQAYSTYEYTFNFIKTEPGIEEALEAVRSRPWLQ